MENTRIRFGSLTVDEDEDEIYSSSSSSVEYSSSSEEEDDDEVEAEDVRSPAHPYDLDSLPKSVLLDVQACFDDRTNATTAFAPLLMKHHIEVTLWVAHPPSVSCLTVHSTGVDAKEFANMPTVVAAQDDLVLLRVTIGRDDRLVPTSYANNYYVYKAGITTETPSLIPLPDTTSFVFADRSAGILRLADGGGFIIVAIHWAGTHGQYDLQQFDSRTWSWSTRLMHADKPERLELGLPALSLHDDDVVYIMAKTKWTNRKASVLAINLKNKLLQGVAKFDANDTTCGLSYLASNCVAGSPTI